ncbi:MAG: S8 family serine peptidase [Hyphomicrobiales bacterium]|nr:S8 family serine peptidase [Hyphomicrobiales bacterium]
MTPLDLVKLPQLMELTAGSSNINVGLIDGPVAIGHPDLAGTNMSEVPGSARGSCAEASSAACLHGTFVAGILSSRRGSPAPAICPDCALLIRPVFAETAAENADPPSAEPEELAAAILECIAAGARILNLSLALMRSPAKAQLALTHALDHAARLGVIVVAAAGNQGAIGGTVITSHPCVIPVSACDLRGRPLNDSNLGHSIGRRGFMAPGERVTSLKAMGESQTSGGTSVAAPFVTGAIALIWSLFPAAGAAELRLAILKAHARARSVTPPLLNAWAAYQVLSASPSRS